MTTYIAPHGDQLSAVAGPTGKYDCTAWAASMALDQATEGAIRVSGRAIRLASPEPVPDRQSPGLNLDDVDAAIHKLTINQVDVDVRRMYDASAALDRIAGGQAAIVQFQRSRLISEGFSFGDPFSGGHAAKMDGIGGLHLDDPLTKRFAISRSQAITLLGSLIVVDRFGHPHQIGSGNAYVGFVVAKNAVHWRVAISGSADYAVFNVDTARRVVIGNPRVRHTGGFSADCSAPASYAWGAHGRQSLVVVRSGFLADLARKAGQTWAVRASHAHIV